MCVEVSLPAHYLIITVLQAIRDPKVVVFASSLTLLGILFPK